MCTMSSVYPVKNYKLQIIQPKWLEDLNNRFRKKIKTNKVLQNFNASELEFIPNKEQYTEWELALIRARYKAAYYLPEMKIQNGSSL